MKKRLIKLISFVVIIAAFIWFFYPLRSFAVMGIYSSQHADISVMRQNGFEINIPSAKGWYPFVMTYNAHGFERFSSIDADMSIMYNFGAFDLASRTSSIYDKQSDKYSSFYGAYVVKQQDGVFGFEEDSSLNMNEVSLAVEYDYTKLVIEDFGCTDLAFNIEDATVSEPYLYAESDGWVRVDAVLTVNGAAHNYNGHVTPYLQYGKPMEEVDIDFEVTTLYGRVYAKYLSEYNCTVMMYVIAPTTEAIDACDEDILSRATITPLS